MFIMGLPMRRQPEKWANYPLKENLAVNEHDLKKHMLGADRAV
jgi:hypothetical protein